MLIKHRTYESSTHRKVNHKKCSYPINLSITEAFAENSKIHDNLSTTMIYDNTSYRNTSTTSPSMIRLR